MRIATHRISIRREGWIYMLVLAFVFVGALIRDINLLMLLFGMLAGPLLYSWWYQWACLRRIEARRIAPAGMHAGDMREVAIELTSARRWFGCWGLGVDDYLRPAGSAGRRPLRAGRGWIVYLRPGETIRLVYQLQMHERGQYEFGPLVVTMSFPLGFVQRRVTFEMPQRLMVWPKLGELQRPLASDQPAPQLRTMSRQRRGFLEGDFYGLREWRPGDNHRWIHWRTTARMGTPMVRQFEQQRNSHIAILLDPWCPADPRAEDREHVELAVSLAATLIAEHCRRPGGGLTLVVPGAGEGDPLVVRGNASAALREEAFDCLAGCRASSTDRLPQLIADAARQFEPGTRLLIVSSRPVDLTNSARFGRFERDPRRAELIARATVIETNQPALDELFAVVREVFVLRIELLLQIAIATLTSLGTLMLGMGEREIALPLIAIVVSASSVYLTDVSGWLRLNARVANVAGSTAVVIFVWDFLQRFGSETQLLAIANLLIYLQFVLLYQAKSISTYWLLTLLSVLQVAVAAALNFEMIFGLLLLIYFFCGLATLGLFSLYRETIRFRPQRPASSAPSPSTSTSVRWPLPCDGTVLTSQWSESVVPPTALGRPFVRQMGGMGIAALAFALVFFFLVPRVERETWRRPIAGTAQPTVGVSEHVQLGELGEIVSNPEGVMRVRFFDEDTDQPYKLAEAPLFRGFYLIAYSRNSWRRAMLSPESMEDAPVGTGLVREEIEIEPLEIRTLFSVYPVINPDDQRHPPQYDFDRDCLLRSPEQAESRVTFTLLTSAFRRGRQFPFVPSTRRVISALDINHGDAHPDSSFFYQLPPRNPLDRLAELAHDKIASLDPDDKIACARALTNHLHDSGIYKYSLIPPQRDPKIDAVEDFLFEHQEGHCEYFATALTLMLRSVDIPARMVIGYAGGEWNPFGYYQVRQLHAHAWVEAYFSFKELPDNLQAEGHRWRHGAWLTLDPTPGVGVSAARIGDTYAWPSPRQLIDFVRSLWSSKIMAMDAERQMHTVYLPLIRHSAAILRLTAASAWGVAVVLVLVGGTSTVLLLALLARTTRGRRWGRRFWMLPALRRFGARRRGRSSIVFYDQFERLLARHGLRRADSTTPLEFARQVAARLAGHPATVAVASVPQGLVETFYLARFGGRHLDKQELQQVEQALARLRTALAATRRR